MLQTTLLAEAVRAIAAGEADVVLVAGGEAKYRAARALSLGVDAPTTQQASNTRPDAVLAPHEDILHPLELERGIVMPVAQYAMMESALRYADGTTLAAHRAELGSCGRRTRPRRGVEPGRVEPRATHRGGDRHGGVGQPDARVSVHQVLTSQWNVDQAAGLILCARPAWPGRCVPEARWVFPLAVAVESHAAARRARAHRALSRLRDRRAATRGAHGYPTGSRRRARSVQLLSAAVRMQCRELGIDHRRTLTVTGGMAFAGGPLNNFVLQAMVRTAEVLRSQPGATALVTAVSGMVTKQGVSLWASRAPQRRFT